MQEFTQFIEPGVILASAVWAIGSIKGATEKLGLRIDQLGEVIKELKESVNDHKDEIKNIQERLLKLELGE